MPDDHLVSTHRPQKSPGPLANVFGSSGLGVGIVLVLLPAAALLFGLGLGLFDSMRLVGLPVLAIFGMVILFGTLALVAMLFQSLRLSNRDEPLALPQGSIRATIALSLIVLFAIISIMLFQSMLGSSYVLKGMTKEQRDEMVIKAPERVVEFVATCNALVPKGNTCSEADERFDLHMQGATPPPGASDLAKQLLVLVGTLMTAVTSFYFASRGETNLARKDETNETKKSESDNALALGSDETESHVDGCDVPITDVTADADLPAARGGVAPATPGARA